VAKLTSTPRNIVATLQQETITELKCKTDKSVINWCFGDETAIIFNGFQEVKKYPMSTNPEAGEYNLTLRNLDASYAGRYICVEPGTTERASAQLTVLGKFITICHE